MNETTYYTANDIAKKLKISKSKAYKLIASGQFAVLRIGKSVRIPEEEFLTWLRLSTK